MTRVVDALQRYLEEELLSGDEKWHCEKCCRKVDTRKKIDLWKLPPVLVIHLKRFEYNSSSGAFVKIGTLLDMPLALDFSEYCSSTQKEQPLYRVVCVANHSGSFDRGHYTSTCYVSGCKNQNSAAGGEWHHFNDANVHRVEEHDVITEQAYVIFLARCSDPQTSRSETWRAVTPHQTVTAPQFWPHQVSRTNSDLTNLMPGRVGIGAAIACSNPRSAILCEESPCESNPRSAIVQSSDSSSTETPTLLSGFTGSFATLQDRFPSFVSRGFSLDVPSECTAKNATSTHDANEVYACENANVANVPVTYAKKELKSCEHANFASIPHGTKAVVRRRTKFDCC